MLKELNSLKVPERRYRFDRIIWSPKNWVVKVKDSNTDGDPVKVTTPIVFEKEFYTEPENTDTVMIIDNVIPSRLNSTRFEFSRNDA